MSQTKRRSFVFPRPQMAWLREESERLDIRRIVDQKRECQTGDEYGYRTAKKLEINRD
jgi:hypothetical protein